MMDVSGTGGSTLEAYLAGATELVTNGTFDTDSDWSKGTGVTISGGVLDVGSDVVGVPASQGATTAVADAWYEFSYEIVSINTVGGGVSLRFGNTLTPIETTTGTKTGTIQATNTDPLQVLKRDGATFDGTVDNISVKELPHYVATAPYDAARPTLREDVGSGKYYLDFDGTDDNLILDGTDFGSSTNATLYKTFRGNAADTSHMMFGTNAGTYVLAARSTHTITYLSGNVGTPVYREDGAIASYATRGDAFTALVDNTDHTIGVEEVDLAAHVNWLNYGFYIGGEYSTTWDSTGRLYAWAVVGNSLNEYDRDLLENFMLSKKTT